MTPEDIDKLEAGRDLDALVAEKVMQHRTPFQKFMVGCPDGRDGCVVAHYDIFDAERVRIPKYSADITAAWQVVEKLRELGFNLSLFYSDEGFYCHFGEAGLAGEADTAPLAICRAALKAVATEQEKPVYGHYEGRYYWTQSQTHYPARIVQVQEPE